MTSRDIELILAVRMFPYWKQWTVAPRTYTRVPHECDLLALSPSGYAHEAEIKISLSDVKADLKKVHQHDDPDNRIKCFWFAMPTDLVDKAEPFVPERAGILEIYDTGGGRQWPGGVMIRRKAKVNRQAVPWGFEDRYQLMRSVMFRYWQGRQKRPA